MPIPWTSPIQNSTSKNRLPNPNTAYYNPRQGSTALLARKIPPVIDSYASRSCKQNPQNFQQNSVSDIAVLSDGNPPERDGRQTRGGVFKPLQCEKAAQQVTTGDLGEKSHRLDKFQLQEMGPLLDEGEPQANRVHQLELEIMELKRRATELETIVIELVGEKRRRCSSQQEQGKADQVHLAKRHRRDEPFEKSNTQTPEKARHSSTERESGKAFRYWNNDRDDPEDTPITSTDSMPPQVNSISVASTDFRQAENREKIRFLEFSAPLRTAAARSLTCLL